MSNKAFKIYKEGCKLNSSKYFISFVYLPVTQTFEAPQALAVIRLTSPMGPEVKYIIITRKTIDAKHQRAPFNSLCMCYMLDNKK